MDFIPKLTTTDWNAEWMDMQTQRDRFDNAASWDARAKTFPVKHGSQSSYVTRFLELADINPNETVLDMGCGTGALATPLAKDGHKVVAADFSRGMLDAMVQDQKEQNVSGVKVMQLSWSEDWPSAGLGHKSVDVALASRSIATFDLGEALDKLTVTARRRACITLPCGPSTKLSEELLAAAGLPRRLGADFLYGFNILASKGINPEVAYIPSKREEYFASLQEACDHYVALINSSVGALTPQEIMNEVPSNLATWLAKEMIETPKGFTFKIPIEVNWAFLAWDCS